MRRNQLVFTPAGWAVFDQYEYHCSSDDDGELIVQTLVKVTLEADDGNGDDPQPRRYRLDEIELVDG